MSDDKLTRRTILAALASTALVSPRWATAQEDCATIRAVRALTEAQIQGIGVWVATDGKVIVNNAIAKQKKLKAMMPSASQKVEKAEIEEILALVSAVAAGTLFIVGVYGALPVATALLSSLAVSKGLFIATAVLAPASINPVETAVLTAVGDIEKALAVVRPQGIVAARTALLAANFLSFASMAYSFMLFLDKLEETTVAGKEFAAMRHEVEVLAAALAPLTVPGNLTAIRQDGLDELMNELTLLASPPCNPVLP